jgi:26S proteasome regulatory subunit N7
VNAGDTEVLDLMFNEAAHFTKIGAWELAYAAYDAIINKEKVGGGKKLDATMAKCRIALFNMDLTKTKTLLSESKRLNDSSGDWDHRNRLKVYEAMYLLTMRDLEGAAKLLQSCIATFTCTEISDYNSFMFYALLANVLHLPRMELKKKIVSDPQVISVIKDIPDMHGFVHSIYDCEYVFCCSIVLPSFLACL